MTYGSLSLLNGAHRIHQRLLSQIPNDILKTLDPNTLKTNFVFSSDRLELMLEIRARGTVYTLGFAQLKDFVYFFWKPHQTLSHRNEVAVVSEMLSEFHENQLIFGSSRANRERALITICESFFRSVYR